MLGDDRSGGAAQLDDGQMLAALDETLVDPDEPQKEHRQPLSLVDGIRCRSIYTRRGSGMRIHTADEVLDRHRSIIRRGLGV